MTAHSKYHYFIILQDTTTGEEQIIKKEVDLSTKYGADTLIEFMWSEGLMACDCNRGLFFNRAKGIERSDDEDCGCGSSRYIVTYSTFGYDELD